MWTRENRDRDDRSRLRYDSDLSDAEGSEVGPLIPPAKSGGNKRTVDIREVTNGVMSVLSTGCQWRAIPKDLPLGSTVHESLVRWTHDRTLERMHHELYVKCREEAGREASPTAAIMDAQSVKGAEKRGASIDPHGFDAGKMVKGKKRHVLVDTQGFVLDTIVTAADIQDRDGALCCWPPCSGCTRGSTMFPSKSSVWSPASPFCAAKGT
jgi:putative transposase